MTTAALTGIAPAFWKLHATPSMPLIFQRYNGAKQDYDEKLRYEVEAPCDIVVDTNALAPGFYAVQTSYTAGNASEVRSERFYIIPHARVIYSVPNELVRIFEWVSETANDDSSRP